MREKIGIVGIYRVIMATIVVVIGVQIVVPFVAAQMDEKNILVATLISLCVFLSLYLTGKKGKLIVAMAVGAILVTVFLFWGVTDSFTFLKQYGNWLMNLSDWDMERFTKYQFLNIIFISFAICFLTILLERFFVLKGAVSLLLTSFLLFNMVQQRLISKVIVCLILIFNLLFLVEWIQTYGRKEKEKEGIRVTVWLLPFFILYLIVIFYLPSNRTVYEWKVVKNIYGGIQSTIIKASQRIELFKNGGSGDFFVNFSGFSEGGKIGGDVIKWDDTVMQITIDDSLKTNLYLTGNIFDTFDGMEWHKTNAYADNTDNTNTLDFIETLYAIKRFDSESVPDFMRESKISISYMDIYTACLFTPLKTRKVLTTDNNIDYEEKQGQFLFDKRQGYGATYQTWFAQINVDQPFYYEMAKEESEYVYESDTVKKTGEKAVKNKKLLNELNEKYFDYLTGANEVTEENLAQHAKNIQEQYLQPYELSEEVKAYVEELTKDCEGTLEKLKAIENALGQFTYTTSPGKIPSEENFLDYFLFQSKEGYCTYYATAFVLLARYEGVPTRYVQGFCVPRNGNGGKEITVKSSMAHAWPEAYIEGIGWIPFEPTPSYAQIRYTPWKAERQVSTEEAKTNFFVQEETRAMEETSVVDILPEQGEEIATHSYFGMLPLLFALFFLGISLLAVVEFLLRRHRYQKMSLQDQIEFEIRNNIRILKFMGFTLQAGETLWELKERVKKSVQQLEIDYEFIDIFEKTKYGNDKVNDEMLLIVMREQNDLLRLLKSIKDWKYIFFFIQFKVIE